MRPGADRLGVRDISDWPKRILELTQGLGADHIVDTAGELKQSISAVRMGGSIALVGLLTGMTTEVDLVALMGKSMHIQSVDVGSREMFEAIDRKSVV